MLIPCIDLQRGQAVQLVHGRKRELAVADVLGLLQRFSRYEWLHVIDLDAATREGQNNALVRQLCVAARRKYKMKVRVGGGIRTVRRAVSLKNLGVQQIIVGSAAFRKGQPISASTTASPSRALRPPTLGFFRAKQPGSACRSVLA